MTVSGVASVKAADQGINVAGVSAYPNPFDDVITIYSNEQEADLQQVVLVNQAGQELLKAVNPVLKANKLELRVPGEKLTPGIYILRVTDRNGVTSNVKLVKL